MKQTITETTLLLLILRWGTRITSNKFLCIRGISLETFVVKRLYPVF